jgi:hypothetical protein
MLMETRNIPKIIFRIKLEGSEYWFIIYIYRERAIVMRLCETVSIQTCSAE